MDSSIATDPRFKLLALDLGCSLRELAGTCFFVWLACYERRTATLSVREANACAESEAFAQAIVDSGLAHFDERGDVVFHGVEERIRFLEAQAERGRKGGKVAGKSRRYNHQANAKQSPSTRASVRLTNSLAPDLALSPDLDLGGAGGSSLAAGPAPAEPIKPPRKRVQKPSEPTAEETQATTRILERLAARTGRFYRPTTAEHARRILRLLRAREASQTLEEREQELRLVVWDRANRWADDPKMEEYLRPSTLFGPEKFPDYLAQAKAAWAKQQASREKPLPAGSVIAMVASAMEERDGVG